MCHMSQARLAHQHASFLFWRLKNVWHRYVTGIFDCALSPNYEATASPLTKALAKTPIAVRGTVCGHGVRGRMLGLCCLLSRWRALLARTADFVALGATSTLPPPQKKKHV